MSASPSVPPVGALVVIAEEAALFASPDAHALQFAVPLNRPGDLTSGHVVEVVAHEGEFIGVKTVEPSLPQQCAGSFGVEAQVELRFWLGSNSLRTVLSRPARVDFEDGTVLELVAGTPVSSFGDHLSAHVGALKLPLELDERDIGLSFSPGPALEVGPSSSGWGEGAELRYGEHSFASRGRAFSRVLSQHPVGDDLLLRFANACGRFELRGRAGDRGSGSAGQGEPELDVDRALHAAGIFPLQGAQRPSSPDAGARWKVPADTPLEWLDGSAAGRTRAALTLTRAPLVQEDERACFDLVAGLALCCEGSAVSRQEDRPLD